MFLMYGFYLMLFGVCIHILRPGGRISKHPNNKLYMACTISLLVITTAANAVQTWLHLCQAIIDFESAKKGYYARLAIHLLKDHLKVNIGCYYIILNSRKRIAYHLVFLSFAVNAIGLASIGIATKAHVDIDTPSSMALFQVGNTLNSSLPNLECGFNAVLIGLSPHLCRRN
ncbi:hypothetical protein Moror_9863 [Moniliophthora roreri MCA 2997]|uniref:Uncharacterized protein n=1 Tax=Moniliophthora roreri (strain MCA 2997) TaxID=1381753 RepID=V2WY47_MONRO|nr:hypothetical protein Moror_9863 [Moniliophthora roreri MCA 2997]